MKTEIYDRFTVTLSDADAMKLDKGFKGCTTHWRCIVYDKANRKQMSFDVYGCAPRPNECTINPLEALYHYCDDAYSFAALNDVEDVMKEFGYDSYKEAKKVYNAMEKAYYKCRKFIGTDDDIWKVIEDLQKEWG